MAVGRQINSKRKTLGSSLFCGFLVDESLSNPSTQEVSRREDKEFKDSLDCIVSLRSLDKGRGKEKLKRADRPPSHFL